MTYTIELPNLDWKKDGAETSVIATLDLDNDMTLEVEIVHNPFEIARYEIVQATIVNDDNEVEKYVNPHLIKVVSDGKVIDARINPLWDTLTAAEVDDLFGLQSGTTRQACNRGDIPNRKSGKVWLILFKDAFSRWGGNNA